VKEEKDDGVMWQQVQLLEKQLASMETQHLAQLNACRNEAEAKIAEVQRKLEQQR